MSDLDEIAVTGIRAFGRHGVYPDERRDGQEFVADVVLSLDTRGAAATDDVADTVHYGELAEEVAAILAGEPVDLLETLAARIADAVLARRPVQQVRVTVHKPAAPIAVAFSDVSVTITRGRMP
ncbi:MULTISPECIES: dihydroneopterin aldolase [unclassified Microbacterium]|uniref:dihydroneopterin aldolase n=1 Tax=unclassified Microbacterium TaxID=2609290 RepID=UPI00214BC81D|nr:MULTISPECIES: dihydroneopterin aldolase [unclassified Microbacterium]MCR2802076.1 dihydroneopterin aldolase [Microbacterium sp. zg.Y818]MCR2825515.1 dihydroneopterin aldolase [Microbacterium sp. zg.Y909]WIM22624.1 dihydroneopterin aldolase [Microbacterium sp. zg-Y818]